jgi:hypothetical protein
MTRRRWAVAIAVVVLVAASTTFFLLRRPADPPVAAAVDAAPQRQLLTQPQAEKLAQQLTSGDVAQVRLATTVSPEQELDAAAISGLASLSPLTFDLESFRETSETTADVTARSGAPQRWVVHLLLTDDSWKISTTEPAR